MQTETKTIQVCNKSIGTVRKIDSLGRIVLSKDFRAQFGWNTGDEIEQIFLADGTMLLRRVASKKEI